MNCIRIMMLTLAALATINTGAQEQSRVTAGFRDFTALSWEIAIPSDNNYLNETSYSGWRLEYRRMLKPAVSVGLAASWNAFDEYIGRKTYSSGDGNSAITTDMVRQVYTVPITLLAHYYPQTNSTLLKPYIGIGLGAQYAELNTYYNIYASSANTWGFVARPEIGTLINLGSAGGPKALVSIGYNLATNDYDAFDLKSLKQFTINVGIGFGR